ncbi:SmORF protein [Babesia bovis T2Bo]|uniref:SmORF n=1 Tax=Babesia bovis TaxID=5865 RepID=A7AUM0_BABBO|nr:SmORF protein [Babesia bovis T2Bo]EDO06631.1 SmORF protein [Babesia bovis T2Bo]|eukprot:XP_001610199.1 SmORF [Babesia bovis]
MVAFNILWKLCAIGLSATATSSDVAQEQPKKESFLSRFFGKKEEAKTQPVEVQERDNTDGKEDIETGEPPRYSVEWHLLPKPENRAALRSFLPRSLSRKVPEDCNEPIGPKLEKQIRNYFSLYGVEWFLLPEPESRAALRKALPSDIAKDVPEDCNKRMWCGLEEYIFKFFKIYATGWYLLPEPESRAALRYVLPRSLAKYVPEDCNEPIDPEVENEIREFFSKTFQKQRKNIEFLGGHMF